MIDKRRPIKLSELRYMDDEGLIEVIKTTASDFAMVHLVNRYKNLVYSKAKIFYADGIDREDIIQEGFIGLYNGVKNYNKDLGVPFLAFAELCIRRQILTALKKAKRFKHQPLNLSVSLNKTVAEDDNNRTWLEMVASEVRDPEEIIIGKEEYQAITDYLGAALTPLEAKVLSFHLDGTNYLDIAETMGRDPKSIDNALQRVKKKTEKYLVKRREKLKARKEE